MGAPKRVATPQKRGGIWYLIRRVPKEFRAYDTQPVRRLSTEIRVADDPKAIRAKPVVAQLDRELLAYWKGRRDGKDDEARRRFEEARDRAKQLGLPYKTAQELADGPLAEILRRVDLLIQRGDVESEVDTAAILGGEQRPKRLISGLIGEFELIESEALRLMNDTQRRKARAPRNRAIDLFIEAIGGDKAVEELTREDGMKFRIALQALVASRTIDIGTANRYMGAVSKLIKTVNLGYQLMLPSIFDGLRISGEVDKQRKAFSTKWIQTVILAPGALDGLNEDARDIIYMMIDHGMRPSELHDGAPEQNHVGDEVPHYSILPIAKVLKTPHSARDLPLVGAGIEIMRRRVGKGFPRYRGKDAFSAAANKYMRDNGLMETPEHTVYGLRHNFEDRLTAAEAPEKVVATVMGHRWHRPRYGQGPSLEQKREWLDRISLTRPEHVTPRV